MEPRVDFGEAGSMTNPRRETFCCGWGQIVGAAILSGLERFFHDERYRPRFDRGGFEGIDVCGFLSELDIVNRATVLCRVETELSWAWCEEDRSGHELAE